MEPMHPELRAALKEAHPQLTDEDIDRVEELTAMRMLVDPQKEPERLAELDRERQLLIQQKMPHYAEVASVVRAQLAQQQLEEPQKRVTVTRKTPKE